MTADALELPEDAPFDAVLLDAPCSATGTIRRHPDVAWTKSETDVIRLAGLQRRLLDKAARLTRPGGRLVYCTCSLEPEEGGGQVADFLNRNPDFERIALTPERLATGIGVNVAAVRERLGANAPLNSWSLVLNPGFISKLKDCGVMLLDSPEDLIPSILPFYGYKSDSKRWDDITAVTDALYKVRGSVRKFHSSEYINGLANGDVCLAVGYSGDVMQARKRAEESKNGVEVAYFIPKEGALMWFDAFAIPKDAAHPAEAHAFIDYMMRPEVAAANTNFVSFANGNLASQKFVKPEIRNNPGIYPDEAVMQRLSVNTAWNDSTQRFVTRAWTRVRTGR